MVDCPPFEAFYRATHGGAEPFPWQSRLAARVAADGWPTEIGVPTGLGKTACLDIAVWALAVQADLAPADRSAPTRVWYVVNRRLLVDAATEHAQRLCRWLGDPRTLVVDWPTAAERHIQSVAAVGDRLTSIGALGTERGPLHVTRLRGGADLGARVPDPSQPAIVLATVPMFASRWLLRGYGSSTSMRPIDAALAGTDCVVLLDEAHLARPLAGLVRPVEQCDVGDPSTVLPIRRSRPIMVALTATGERSADRFDLDDDDLDHPVVRERLTANKPVELRQSADKRLSQDVAAAAVDLLSAAPDPTTCVVFVNSPKRAREVWSIAASAARRAGLDVETVLLTGRMREREADRVRRRLLDADHGVRSGSTAQHDRHLLVVATQTLEVGADVDFDLLVTETAGVRALVQRFGRLNRLGVKPGARAVVCHAEDAKPVSIYGDEPATVWATLNEAVRRGPLDLGPGAIGAVLGDPDDAAPRTAELLPAHLWEWAKTTVPPPGEAPIEPFIESLDDTTATVSVLWRAWPPAPAGPHGEQVHVLEPRVRGDEAVELPIGAAKDWLSPLGWVRRVARDGTALEEVLPSELRPGDQVVVHVSAGGYDEFGWNPASTEPVLDVSALLTGTLLLDRDRAVIGNLVVLSESPELDQALRAFESTVTDEYAGDDQLEVGAAAVAHAMVTAVPHPWLADAAAGPAWATFVDRLQTARLDEPLHGPPQLVAPAGARATASVRSDAFDELSCEASSVRLDAHLSAVGEAAAAIARQIGLPPPLVEIVRRAGAFHDQGKVDPRFQRWLDPAGRSSEPVAKSSMRRGRWEHARVASGWPRGGRHETLSLRLLGAAIAAGADGGPDPELLLHLVASHHGHGRPSLPTSVDTVPITTTACIDGIDVAVSGDLSIGEWDQPARFRRLCERYGYWGLALLETIVRQADHAASGEVGRISAEIVEVA